jgi:hypothetical protein
MTAVEFIEDYLKFKGIIIEKENYPQVIIGVINDAKEMEKENTDNKVIHFAEWLTKKHSYTLMALYEHFEEEFYNDKL